MRYHLQNKNKKSRLLGGILGIITQLFLIVNQLVSFCYTDYCRRSVVYDMYEILFWSLFTTVCLVIRREVELFMICMRYYFEAYSQRRDCHHTHGICCLWYVWDTILKPIHNVGHLAAVDVEVVYDMYEILFWSLFTTAFLPWKIRLWLFMICMRYYFEAYSQHNFQNCNLRESCLWYVWDTILKPIHNEELVYIYGNKVVYDMYEILFWSLFTTIGSKVSGRRLLFMICMRYYFEAYSQRWRQHPVADAVVYDMYEILFWSLFTTFWPSTLRMPTLFMICMRYYFEAYSQLTHSSDLSMDSCLWYVWDTILKPIHNSKRWRYWPGTVVYDMYEILFWSLFTTNMRIELREISCLWYVWDTILKPIHNDTLLWMSCPQVVYDMYEILFWSLFTTSPCRTSSPPALFMICMRYYFEAYSQLYWLL